MQMIHILKMSVLSANFVLFPLFHSMQNKAVRVLCQKQAHNDLFKNPFINKFLEQLTVTRFEKIWNNEISCTVLEGLVSK